MVKCLRISLRSIILRTLWISLLLFGFASAARLKNTVDLPTNPLHWQRYLKQLRSVLATQRMSLRYEIPAATSGAQPEIKYADSEDYFRAGPAYIRPVTIPEDTWAALKTLIYTVIFMGIPAGFTWLTAGLDFGDVTSLIDKIKDSIGSKEAQTQRIDKAFRECTLLSKHHYFSWYGEFMELVDNWNEIKDIGGDALRDEKLRTKYLSYISTIFPHIVSHADINPAITVAQLHKLVETNLSRDHITVDKYTHRDPTNPTVEQSMSGQSHVANAGITQVQHGQEWQSFHGDASTGYTQGTGNDYYDGNEHGEHDEQPFVAAMAQFLAN